MSPTSNFKYGRRRHPYHPYHHRPKHLSISFLFIFFYSYSLILSVHPSLLFFFSPSPFHKKFQDKNFISVASKTNSMEPFLMWGCKKKSFANSCGVGIERIHMGMWARKWWWGKEVGSCGSGGDNHCCQWFAGFFILLDLVSFEFNITICWSVWKLLYVLFFLCLDSVILTFKITLL